MSASDKKKLRKEQNAAALTEKQQKEKKEAKKLKTYTVTFVIVMVLIVAILAGVALRTPIESLINDSTNAITVGNYKINATEFNYFYVDAANNFYQTYYEAYSSYGDYAELYIQMMTGLSASTALDAQVINDETGETWADYFIEQAKTNAAWTYAMYDKAVAAGFTMPDDYKSELDMVDDYMDVYATAYGYSSTNSYLRAIYGSGADIDSYVKYNETSLLAKAYAADYLDKLEFTDENFREYEKDKYDDFSSFSYALYNITVNDYLKFLYPEEKTDSETASSTSTKEYTDEERAAAEAAAKAAADTLANEANSDIEKLNLAIAGLDIFANVDKDEVDTATEVSDALLTTLTNEKISTWLTEEGREVGDLTVIENATEDSDGNKTVTSYSVVLFQERNDNLMHLANVRHCLIAYQGGTKDTTTGETTYSDAEKAAAREEAEILLKDWLAGEQTDEAFAKLADQNSDDTPEGGLYEDITPETNFVQEFLDWCFEDGRKAGDTGIIESIYGAHIMYYKEAGELTYRDYMINAELEEAAYTAWEEEILKAYTVTENNLTRVDRDHVITG